jgi:hypothetical protein
MMCDTDGGDTAGKVKPIFAVPPNWRREIEFGVFEYGG